MVGVGVAFLFVLVILIIPYFELMFANAYIELKKAKEGKCLTLIEVNCSIGARKDLGRPTTTALENKNNFMDYLQIL